MKFFRSLFSKYTFSFFNLSKEVIIAATLISINIFYPSTALAGIFSFISGDKASASSIEPNIPNSQNMTVLKAIVNSNPSPLALRDHPILASENALVAEIGPAGTASEIDDSTSYSTEISTYIVRSGDTLSGIADMFNVSINTIVWANDISRNATLREGQTLVILPITGIRHTVKKGETIQKIVDKYKGDLEEVLQFNDLSINSTIREGQTVIIPDAEMTSVQRPSGSSPAPSYANYYMRPIKGGRKSQGLHGHNGVDLAAPIGTPIYASASGKVIVSVSNGGWNGGYGNYIIISHPNGTQTLYSHNQTNLVSVGDKVEKGEMIGRIGITGKTTGPHIHFEIRGAKNPF